MTRHLPVVGSTAASTAFAIERLDGPGGRHLFLDGNAKVTAGNGSFEAPAANAFSLVNVDDCPYHTDVCAKACYVNALADARPDVAEAYAHNSRVIREILGSLDLPEWAITFARWVSEHARGGFRWHVSGDVFSLDYAWFISDVCELTPTVRHWIYTRSFPIAHPLVGVSTAYGGNLSLNLSADRDNWREATAFRDRWKAGRLCYLVTDVDAADGATDIPVNLGPDDVLFPDYALRPRQFATLAESPWWQSITPAQRGLVCPVDAHGKSEKRRCGPCDRCLK